MNRAELDVDQKVFAKFFDDGRRDRVFVDVGAARPDYLSISQLFRQKGWRVICIEPNPEFASLHRELGHEVYECACGAVDEDEVEFMLANSHGQAYEGGSVTYESFSSLSLKPGYRSLLPDNVELKPIKVKVRRLDSILEEAGVSSVDVISADVEGWELEVLQGVDLRRINPSVIILENFLRDKAYKRRLRQLGYVLWKRLFPNEVYIRPVLLRRMPWAERLAVMLSG
jgi:FkbM family methyltransferase